jgi:hypothetical protein
MLVLARELPGEMRSLGLATESSIIVVIAERLTAHLGRRDPLAGRVVLSRAGVGLCGAQGVIGALAGRLNRAKSLPKLD